MKTTIKTLVAAVSISTTAIAQDVIIFKNGEEKNVKVIEILPTEIKYKKFENLDGPLYAEEKAKIFMIRYENGQKDVFKDVAKETPVKTEVVQPESKEITNHNYFNVDPATYGNHDLIIKMNGDSIKCNIESVSNTSLSYKILRHGMDTRSTMPMSNVSKYINANPAERVKEIVIVTEQPVLEQKTEYPAKAEVNPVDEDEFLPEARRYGGPRMGATLVGPGVFRDALNAEGKK